MDSESVCIGSVPNVRLEKLSRLAPLFIMLMAQWVTMRRS
jgi:hypothetical protein